jgi:hypothetical protein
MAIFLLAGNQNGPLFAISPFYLLLLAAAWLAPQAPRLWHTVKLSMQKSGLQVGASVVWLQFALLLLAQLNYGEARDEHPEIQQRRESRGQSSVTLMVSTA